MASIFRIGLFEWPIDSLQQLDRSTRRIILENGGKHNHESKTKTKKDKKTTIQKKNLIVFTNQTRKHQALLLHTYTTCLTTWLHCTVTCLLHILLHTYTNCLTTWLHCTATCLLHILLHTYATCLTTWLHCTVTCLLHVLLHTYTNCLTTWLHCTVTCLSHILLRVSHATTLLLQGSFYKAAFTHAAINRA